MGRDLTCSTEITTAPNLNGDFLWEHVHLFHECKIAYYFMNTLFKGILVMSFTTLERITKLCSIFFLEHLNLLDWYLCLGNHLYCFPLLKSITACQDSWLSWSPDDQEFVNYNIFLSLKTTECFWFLKQNVAREQSSFP